MNLLSKSSECGVCVVISEKITVPGAVHGFASNGGVLPLGDGVFGIRFVMMNEKFMLVQLVSFGVKNPVKYSLWKKPEKKVVKKVIEDCNVSEEELL